MILLKVSLFKTLYGKEYTWDMLSFLQTNTTADLYKKVASDRKCLSCI